MDCQTEKVRHHFQRLVVRQTSLWLHRMAHGDPVLFEDQAQPAWHLMLLQQQLRDPRSTRRRPVRMVVVLAHSWFLVLGFWVLVSGFWVLGIASLLSL